MSESTATTATPPATHDQPRLLKLELRDVGQLFNSMDPAPFHEKDLDHDAEEFLVSWAQEYHVKAPLKLVVYLRQLPAGADAQQMIEQAVHNYFAYRAEMTLREFRRLLRLGRVSLAIGLVFLAACFGVSELVGHLGDWVLLKFLRESIIIAGWVAMWRPMEIFLYDWWPVRARRLIFQKMSRMPVEVHHRP